MLNKLNKLISGRILTNVCMKNYTTFGIGGKISYLIYPNNKKEILEILNIAKENSISIFFLGSGTNLLVSDSGFKGIVISLSKTFKKIEISDNFTINTDSGVMLGNLVKKAISKGIGGLESLIGVPGTVGGALIMNAGAYGEEISNYFESARTLTINGIQKTYNKDDIQFGYRYSSFNNEIITDLTLKCFKGNLKLINNNKKMFSDKRKNNQPLRYRSAGSIFKNPTNGPPAGYLIDKVGLKGTIQGGAQISDKHANFIINYNKAKSSDVIFLIKLIRKLVKQKFNTLLKLEIKLLGFNKNIYNELVYDN